MQTLSDILILGNQAEDAGTPLVKNWPQVRGSLSLLDRVIGLEKVPVTNFSTMFPVRFDELRDELQRAFPSRRVYKIVQREIPRLLSVVGHVEDGWEALRVLTRNANREDIERRLWALTAPARAAGLSPSDVRRRWVWSLAAECDINYFRNVFRDAASAQDLLRGASRKTLRQVVTAKKLHAHAHQRRQTLRSGVVGFDELFEIDEIVASGLLPLERIGAPPIYDRRGRIRVVLPSKLAQIHATAPKSQPTNLQELWQAIVAAKIFDDGDDPSADDLLVCSIWAKINALAASVLGIAPKTWVIYLARARAVLLKHATHPVVNPHQMPPHLEAMISTQREKWALSALWHRITSSKLEGIEQVSPKDLLEIEIWRLLWHPRTDDLSSHSLRQYEMIARNVLVRHTSIENDPLRRVKQSWSNLPTAFDAVLAPIRKAAEKALLRPEEVTPGWLIEMGFQETTLATLWAARDSRDQALEPASTPVEPDPVAVAWQYLRVAARARGIDTSRLGTIATPAIRDGKCPRTIDRSWACEVSASLPRQKNAKFRMELRGFDEMYADPTLLPMLGTGPIGDLPDQRRKGNLELPEKLSRDLETFGIAVGHCANTRRGCRSLMCDLYTRAIEQRIPAQVETLRDLLLRAAQLGMTGRKLCRAKGLYSKLVREEIRLIKERWKNLPFEE